MEQPLISVVIPAYNVAPFIEEAIRSIMTQTYENLEIIVVDDCSTDDTYAILQRLAAEDSRIRLYRNERNKRIVETLNYAIEVARGSYIARMDGDDVSLPQKIEAQYRFLQEHPEIDLVGINVIMIDEQGKTIHNEEYPSTPEDIREASRFVSPVPHFWLTKTSVYHTVGKYRIPSAEDLDFILRAMDHGFRLANLKEFLYLIRHRQGNTASALGLTQIRSIAYVRKLHEERAINKTTKDSYSDANLIKALEVPAFEKKRFNWSSRFHFRYVENKHKNYFLALVYRVLAILISPVYQLRPIYNRWRYKKFKKAKAAS
jgi:glycosyltransferase involved in cell wall biosynthesis